MLLRKLTRAGLVALACLLLGGGLTLAQENPLEPSEILDEDGGETATEVPLRGADGQIIEEILVTSQSRNTHDDQSISETSFSGADLKAMRIQDISDIARFTPGLEINTAFAASNPTLFIRGIGLKDYNANAAGAVPIFFDGMAINSPVGQLFQLFDVKNVTVLKGPQSGRWGRNATAGAIIVDSNLPDGEWSSEGSLTYGSYNDVEVEGAIGFPIIDEVLSGRVAFSYQRRDGYTRNGCAGWNPEANGFLENSQAEVQELFTALDPQPNKVTVYSSNGNPQSTQRYLWGNSALAAELRAGFERRSVSAAFDASGTPVYYQGGNALELGSGRDTACVLDSPGKIWNYSGQEKGRGIAGEFSPFPNNPTLEDFQGLKSHTNNAHNWAARAMFLYAPTDDIEVLFSFHGGQNLSDSAHLQMLPAEEGRLPFDLPCTEPNPCLIPESLAVQFREPSAKAPLWGWTEAAAGETLIEIPGILRAGNSPASGRRGSDPYLGFYDRDGQELLDIWGAGIVGRWDEGRFSLHSLTGYEANQRLVEDEGDGTPRKLLYTDWSDESWQASQEFRVEVERDDFSWQAGVYGLYEKVDAVNRFPAALQRNWTQRFDQSLSSVAAYASGHYDFINDRNSRPGLELLRLSAALRASREHKYFQVRSTVFSRTGTAVDIIQAPPNDAIWSGVTGDVMLSWTPVIMDEYDFTLHAKFNRGMKSGHFNAGLSENPNPMDPEKLVSLLAPVNPEHIDAVEIGLDSSWLEKRVLLSAAFYRYWYQDLQVFDLVNEAGSIPTQQLLNADANILGIEGDLEIFPVEGMMLGFGFNWLDSTFSEFVVSKRQSVGGGASGNRQLLYFDYSGNPTIAAPKFTLNGTAEYQYFIPGFGTVNPRIDYSYQTEVFLDPQGLELISMPAYWYLDLRLAFLTPDEDLEVAFWMSNVTDQQYLVDVFDLSREYREVLQVWGEPRMMGVTVSFFY
ncbi:MAG: TonB-dependent receptor plug domain-containing protein [Myxococcota bacterium]|nr:TonB-dependent receptor plug domain-containing protein [Myxococcota bacterium]